MQPLIATLVASFIVVALALATPAAQASEVVEYYHQALDHYFITSDANEKRALDAGVHSGWVRTGQTFQVFNAGDARLANSLPVCRFYGNPARGLDSHFYSATPQECVDVKARFPDDWLLESDNVFRVHGVSAAGLCPANTTATYRLYNGRPDVNHRYTTDLSVVDAMLAKGYTLEGIGTLRPIVFCAAAIAPPAPAAGTPVCTLAVSTEFPILGLPLEMTATCSGAPTTYAWINCVASVRTCTVNSDVAGAVMYGIVATNALGAGKPATITLNWQPAASAAPSCTLSASPGAPQVGFPVVLSASCSENPVRFEWLACSPLTPDACTAVPECLASTITCSPIGTQQGAALYALRASNNAGTSAKSSVGVTWVAPTGQPPPPGGSIPSCVLIPSSSTPAINTTLTLTASCTNTPTVYEWVGCASVSTICTTTESTIGARSYTVYGRNISGVSVAATVSVTWQVPPTGPPVCTLSANPANPYAGGTTILTANCTQSPTSYTWVNCSNVTGNSCMAANAQTGTVMYSVTGRNVFGPSAPASLTLNWTPPPATGGDFCGNFANVKFVNLVWGGQFTTNHPDGGFEDDMVLVGRIRVPSNATGSSIAGLVSAVEFIDGPASRTMSLSPSSCDFRGFQAGISPTPDPTGASRPMAWGFGINPNFQFALSGMPGSQAKLIPGQTYYVNIRNRDFNGGGVTCPTPECNMRITVNAPH